MNKPDYIDLIHRDIDGELSKDEKEHLQALLAKDIKIRRSYDHLVKATGAVGKIPRQEPPADLVNNVMNRIDQSRYQDRRSHLLDSLIAFLEPRRRMVTAFASIIIIAVVFTFVIDQKNTGSVSDLTGTIGAGPAEVTTFTLTGVNFNGIFRWQTDAEKYVLEGSLKHNGDYKVRIQFYPRESVKLIGQRSETVMFYNEPDQNFVWLESSGDQKFDLTFGTTLIAAEYAVIEIDAAGESPIAKKIILN